MRVGMIGTGAISHKHAEAYRNIGYELTVCTDIFEAAGKNFADQYGVEFVKTYEDVCRHPKVDYVDVCTFPNFRLQPVGGQVVLLGFGDQPRLAQPRFADDRAQASGSGAVPVDRSAQP